MLTRALPILAVIGFVVSTGGAAVEKFQQSDQMLPSPNAQRNAAGAPGSGYWQNRADYAIEVTLDEKAHRLSGRATITYQNASPDTLSYLWLQVDPNLFSRDADARALARPPADLTKVPYRALQEMLVAEKYSSDLVINSVKAANGQVLPHTIVKTMMRVDLPAPLVSGAAFTFSLTWNYQLNPATGSSFRTGYEIFPEDGNALYAIAQFITRLAAYTPRFCARRTTFTSLILPTSGDS